VNYTYKYISDENNVYLEYETHYVPSESGYVPLPRKDKSYLKKIDGLWYIDLQYEMDLLGPYLEYELGTEKPCLLNSNKKDEYITYNLSALHFCDLVSITEDLWHMNNRGLYNSGEIRKAMDNELATYRQKFESEVVSQLRLLDIKSLQVNHRGGEYWGGSCSIEADLTLPVQKEYDNQKINLSVYVPYRTGNLRLGKTDFIGVNSSELNAFIDKKFDFLTQNEHFRVLFYQHDVRNIALSMAGKQEGPVIYMPGSDYITIQGKWGNETDKLSDDYDLRYEFMNYYDTEGYLSSTWYVFYGSSSLLDNLSSAFSESAIAKAKANELIDSLNQEKNLDCNIDFYSFRASSKDEYIGVGSEWKVGFYIKGEDSCPCGIELSLVNKKDEGLVLFDHFFQYGGRQGCIML
jgi:hypothetical protein